ncbi:hypothetical protein G0U57_010906, partial [Chelydra serpentina]
MELVKKILQIWRKNVSVASASLCSVILTGIEKIMEVEFKCPEKKWRIGYSLCYFFLPFLVFILMGLAFQPECCSSDNGCCCSRCGCGCLIKVLMPSVIWIAILLLDGRYMACMWKTSEENIPADNTKQPSNFYIASQISGLLAVLLIVFSFSVFKCCSRRRRKPGEREEALPMEDILTRKQKCTQKLMTDILEPHVSVCLDKVLTIAEEEGLCDR